MTTMNFKSSVSASDSSFANDTVPYMVQLKLHRLRHILGLPPEIYDRYAVIEAHRAGVDVRESIDLFEWYAPDFQQVVVLVNESINHSEEFLNGILPEEERKWLEHGYHRQNLRPIEHIIMCDCLPTIGMEPVTFRSQCNKANTFQVCSRNDNDPSLHHREINDSHTCLTCGGGQYPPGNHYGSSENRDLCEPEDDSYSLHHRRETTLDHYSHPATNDSHIGGDLCETMGNNHLECTRNDASTSTIVLYDDANNNNLIYIDNNPEAIKAFVINYINGLEEKEALKLLLDHCSAFRKFLRLEPFTKDELEDIERKGIDINMFLPVRRYVDDNYPSFCVSNSSNNGGHGSDARTTLPNTQCNETPTTLPSSHPSDFSSSQRAILPVATPCFGIDYEEEDTVPVSRGESIPTSPLDHDGSAFPLDDDSAKVDVSIRMVENTTYLWDGDVCSTNPDASTGDSIMVGCVDAIVPDSFDMEP